MNPAERPTHEGPAATFESSQSHDPGNPSANEVQQAVNVETAGDDVPAAAATLPHSAEEESAALRQEVETLRAQSDDYLEQWRRTAADFANFKRRSEQDRAEIAKLFNEGLVKQLLPILDNFERALAAVPDDIRSTSWVEGIALTDKQLHSALEKEGLCAIEAIGQPFDPNVHEAVAHGPSDAPEDQVIEEFQKGYKLHDRVIRPSMVKVSRRS